MKEFRPIDRGIAGSDLCQRNPLAMLPRDIVTLHVSMMLKPATGVTAFVDSPLWQQAPFEEPLTVAA